MIHLGHYLALSALIFTIGAAGFLARRNVLVALMSIELMLNAVNLTLIAANRFQPLTPGGSVTDAAGNVTQAAGSIAPLGHGFAFFVIAVAAAEAAVGLAIVLSFYRLRKTVRSDAADMLRG
ncbi:MAG: NADH-quinone oxidoreductase subunit NuoK [Polyangiales bacterium]